MAAASTYPFSSLSVAVRRRDDAGTYEFGVVIDGAFVAFAVRKTGGVDDDIARAREADRTAQAAAAAQTPPPPPPTASGSVPQHAAGELSAGYTPPTG